MYFGQCIIFGRLFLQLETLHLSLLELLIYLYIFEWDNNACPRSSGNFNRVMIPKNVPEALALADLLRLTHLPALRLRDAVSC